MKKQALTILCLFTILLAGCGSSADSSGFTTVSYGNSSSDNNVVEIRDKFFIRQCDDIYMNPEDYEDKIIKLEGIYEEWYDDDELQYYIYRVTPGCCGDDGQVGFDFIYDGAKPKVGDWISVMGKIEITDNGYMLLNVFDLTVSDVRGEAMVTN